MAFDLGRHRRIELAQSKGRELSGIGMCYPGTAHEVPPSSRCLRMRNKDAQERKDNRRAILSQEIRTHSSKPWASCRNRWSTRDLAMYMALTERSSTAAT